MSLPTTEIPLHPIQTAKSTASAHHGDSNLSRRSSPTPVVTPLEKIGSEPVRPAGRRRISGKNDAVEEAARRENLNAMGKLYAKLGQYSVAARYALYILPVALILLIPVIVGATLPESDKIGGVRVVWFFTWILVVWLLLWAMKFVAKAAPYVFAFFAGAANSGVKKYARVLRNLENTIMVLGWVIVSFVLFEVLFDTAAAGNTPDPWTSVAKEVLAAILVATIIFSVEKIFVQLIAVSYHARSFNNKIAEAKRHAYLLGLMFDASRAMFPMYGKDFLEEDLIIHNNMEAFLKKEFASNGAHGTRVSNGRVFNGLNRIGRYAGRIGGNIESAFGNIAQELTGRQVLSPKSGQSIAIEAMEKSKSAKALAQRIWYSFVAEGNDDLYLEDVLEVLGHDKEDLAVECFDMLDQDNNGDLSLQETILRFSELSLSRKAIARSMHDVSQAIQALDSTLSAVALLLSVFALICFLDDGFSSILSTASTTLLSLSFVFSATAQEFLGSCIFLFVKHPYDVSDRVDIVGPDGLNRLVVETISLLWSEFKRVDDGERVQISNSILNNLWVNNLTRSNTHIERIDLYVDFGTTIEDIELVRQEMESFVRSPENKRDYRPEIILRVLGVGSMDKLQLRLEYQHKSNWAVENIRAARHSKIMCALVLALRKCSINGPGGGGLALGDPGNPAYSVTVSDQTAAAARDKVAKDAEKARLDKRAPPPTDDEPRSPTDRKSSNNNTPALAPISETMAIQAMNSLHYVGDTTREDDHDEINIDGSKDSAGIRRKPSSNTLDLPSMSKPRTSSRGGRRPAGMAVTFYDGLSRVASDQQSGNSDAHRSASLAAVISPIQRAPTTTSGQGQLNDGSTVVEQVHGTEHSTGSTSPTARRVLSRDQTSTIEEAAQIP